MPVSSVPQLCVPSRACESVFEAKLELACGYNDIPPCCLHLDSVVLESDALVG